MAEKSAKVKRPVFGLHLKNLDALYKSYMPFLDGGGIFVPTTKDFKLGRQVAVKLKLMDKGDEYKIKGVVAWITPESAQGRWKYGFGIQFIGDQGHEVRDKIEGLLAGALESGKPTNTL